MCVCGHSDVETTLDRLEGKCVSVVSTSVPSAICGIPSAPPQGADKN